MARGWESKSVEEMRELDMAAAEPVRHAMTLEELERARQLETLQLARARSQDQLSAARSPAQRMMFERALAALDEQIRLLEADSAGVARHPDKNGDKDGEKDPPRGEGEADERAD